MWLFRHQRGLGAVALSQRGASMSRVKFDESAFADVAHDDCPLDSLDASEVRLVTGKQGCASDFGVCVGWWVARGSSESFLERYK